MSQVIEVKVSLTDDAMRTLKLATEDQSVTQVEFIQALLEKTLEQKAVAYARSRLNLHKKTVVQMIQKNAKGFESLEAAYIYLGLSESVEIFGGIRKVYDEIYVKTGNPLPPSKIRANNVVAVNA